jgi:hypothetical protein
MAKSSIFSSTYYRYFGLVILSIFAIEISISTPPVLANCADRVASLELVEPVMKRLWERLQHQKQYPWGQDNPYQQIHGNRIDLNENFDRLTGKQKQQVLSVLKLDYNSNWFNLLDRSQQQAALHNPEIGAMSPYQVFASDGRILSTPYDGCTRMTLLTERERFGWYHLQASSSTGANSLLLRNVGYPQWRKVKFPIDAGQEKVVRQKFWQSVGFNQANKGWWIAWVPEQGYFEINLPTESPLTQLQRFWQIAPSQYHYVVVNNDGTLLARH